jgi:hypothetical protein
VLRNISAMMALINLVAATVYAQLVVFAKRQLDASDSRVALLYAPGSAGVVLLSLAAGPVRRRLSFSVAALGACWLTACSPWCWPHPHRAAGLGPRLAFELAKEGPCLAG